MTDLQTAFAAAVAGGWCPRNVCSEPSELARLEVSTARGRCLAPLIVDGDVLYADPHARPEPGDLVSFALSQRGADAQNGAPITGQPIWRRGDRWTKLYTRYHGIEMLAERAHTASATLLACESLDDAPVLWPIRNVRRGARLLFGDGVWAAELGENAATTIAYVQQSFGSSPSNSGTGLVGTGVSFTPQVSCDVEVTVTATVDTLDPDNGVSFSAGVVGAAGSLLNAGTDIWPGNSNTKGIGTSVATYALTAGTAYTAGLLCLNPSSLTAKCYDLSCTVEVIKR